MNPSACCSQQQASHCGSSFSTLRDSLSPNTFLSASIVEFRRGIHRGLSELATCAVQRNKNGNSCAAAGVFVSSYDLQYLLQQFTAVDWGAVLAQHDEILESSTARTRIQPQHKPEQINEDVAPSAGHSSHKNTSILEVFLEVVQDPRCLPLPCLLPVLKTLIQAILEYCGLPCCRHQQYKWPHLRHQSASFVATTTNNQPAQTCVRRFIVSALHRIPALRQESNWIRLLPKLGRNDDSNNHNHNQSAISLPRVGLRLILIKEWMFEFPPSECCFISSLCNLLDALDQMDVQALSETSVMRIKGDRNDWSSGAYHGVRGRSKVVDHLHGDSDQEGGGEESAQPFSVLRSRCSWTNQNSSAGFVPSTKRALKYSERNNGSENGAAVQSSTRQQERKIRQVYRTKCLKRLLAMTSRKVDFSSNKPQSLHQQQRRQEQQQWFVVLNRLLDEIVQCKQVSSVFYCIVLFVDQECRSGERSSVFSFCNLADLLWARRRRHPLYVALYFELLAECSYFDDVEKLSVALKPFGAMVSECMEQVAFDEEQDEDDHQTDEAATQPPGTTHSPTSSRTMEPFYRYYFAKLLTRRGALLKSQSEETCFVSMVTQLSVLFGSVHDWIPMQQDQNCKDHAHVVASMIEALQFAGVLGLSSCDFVENATNHSPNKARSWFFEWPQFLLREATKWCDVSFRRQGLLSTISLVNGIPEDRDNSRKAPLKHDNATAEAVHLNSDVLSHVFSYLGYKRVVWLREICSVWRDIADGERLWHELYQCRYPFLAEDQQAFLLQAENKHENSASRNDRKTWKQLFQDKWAAEREVRSRRSRSSRDYVLCGFVGCNTILPSGASRRKHHEQHRRQDSSQAKRSATSLKKRTKKSTTQETACSSTATTSQLGNKRRKSSSVTRTDAKTKKRNISVQGLSKCSSPPTKLE
ncbi:hypothetical protein ACA910_015213 [Epithemia clementina (nom. ined.)]